MLRTSIARPTIAVLCLFFVGATTASAGSINCFKAKTRSEFAICESATLVRLDKRLSDTYRQVVASNPADKEVKRSQRQWPAMRDARCFKDETCLIGEYQDRIKELQLQADIYAAADGA